MSLSAEELRHMREIDIMKLKREELVDIDDIVIDPEKSVENRIRSFMEQAKNPYAQKVGEYILQIGFEEGTDDSIDDRIILLIKRKIQLMV